MKTPALQLMNINRKEGREHQQQKQSQKFCTGAPVHKRGNRDQTGPQCSLKLANIATRHPDGPSPPCTTQKLWLSVHSLGQGAGSDQKPLRQQRLSGGEWSRC